MMDKKRKALRSFVLLLLLVQMLLPSGSIACGGYQRSRVHINMMHPDLPLWKYAAGDLGFIQQSWARSYLFVAYRYLSGRPLHDDEQTAALKLWHKRLDGDYSFNQRDIAMENWVKARNEIFPGPDPEIYREEFSEHRSFASHITQNALDTARETLLNRVNKFGPDSEVVTEWLHAQDLVFSPSRRKIPKELPETSPLLARADRKYQIAAANYYQENYDKAIRQFRRISTDLHSPWRTVSLYLVARCMSELADKNTDKALREKSDLYVRSLLKTNACRNFRLDLIDLIEGGYHPTGTSGLKGIVENLCSTRDKSFARDLENLTHLLGEVDYVDEANQKEISDLKKNLGVAEIDLTDWLLTMHPSSPLYGSEPSNNNDLKRLLSRRQQLAQHSIARWRQSHSLPWLLASATYCDFTDKSNADLLAAVEMLKPDSPAYLTCSFYLHDYLLQQHQSERVRKRLDAILANEKKLPTSTLNIFLSQRMAASDNTWDYLKNTVQSTATMASADSSLSASDLPDDWKLLEQQSNYIFFRYPVIDSLSAAELNTKLPLCYWYEFAKSKGVPAALRAELVPVAWVRAHALGNHTMADALESELRVVRPDLRKGLDAYHAAATVQEKWFCLSYMMLANKHLSPHLPVRSGDYLYDVEFWTPKSAPRKPGPNKNGDFYMYEFPVGAYNGDYFFRQKLWSYVFDGGVEQVLTKQQNLDAKNELALLNKNQACVFLGDPVFEWAKAHPSDPRIPEALFALAHLPAKDPQSHELSTKYSRRAYALLTTRFASTQWAKNVQCWY